MTRLRTFVSTDRQVDRAGALISRNVVPGFGMDSRWNGFMQFRYLDQNILSGSQLIRRRQFGYVLQFSPSRLFTQIAANVASTVAVLPNFFRLTFTSSSATNLDSRFD